LTNIVYVMDTRGPLFDGRAESILGRYSSHLADFISERAVTDIRAYLPTQYMYLGHHGGDPRHNPVPADAGRLAASVLAERQTANEYLVRGDLVTYGAWIEGTSLMNEVIWPGRLRRGLSGRFPGYHTFRIIAQELNAEAVVIAEQELIPYLGELNA
jgi:hypothetical protein